ncbi:prepilin-type N-terminal cleavage/methylation domain-containing protein [Pseudoneobacillus sp. C159]
MVKLNNRGITLVELLVTITLSLTIAGLISSVLVQTFRSMEISDTHINLRQQANIIVSMITSSHLSSGSDPYTIAYQRTDATNWNLTIGDNLISTQDYDIRIELKSSSGGSFVIDTANPTITNLSLSLNKKIPLHVQKLMLTNKKDPSKKFELTTIISRL